MDTLHNVYNKIEYNNKYNKENYDRLNIQVPKGKKAIIQTYAESKGYKSLNAYVNDLIDKNISGGGKTLEMIGPLRGLRSSASGNVCLL